MWSPGLHEGTFVVAAKTIGHISVVAASFSYPEGRKDSVRGGGAVLLF